MENNKKLLYTTKYFDVIDSDGWKGIEIKNINVVVFPYILGESGLPEKVILIEELNPLRKNGKDITIVTGDAEGEDPDLLSTAIRELNEETGYNIEELSRWTYLGTLTNNKIIRQEQPCFAVNCTGIEPQLKKGDGSLAEKEIKVRVMDSSDALSLDCIYIHALFMRLFRYVFDKKI